MVQFLLDIRRRPLPECGYILKYSTIRFWLGACGLVAATILMLLAVGMFLHEAGHVLSAVLSGIPFHQVEFDSLVPTM